MKNIFFAVLLTTLGILHMPAFAKEGCSILTNYPLDGDLGDTPKQPYIISIVGFETGKSDFPTECLQEFKDTVKEKLSDDIIGATIVGYASQLGDADDNAELSDLRASTVWYIMRHDMSATFFPMDIRPSGESMSNIYDMSNDNRKNFRSVEVYFHYPQMTDNYTDIIFLKEWKEKYAPNNKKCKADELFTEYISHLRAGKSDNEFDSDKITKTSKECGGASNDATGAQVLTILELYRNLSEYHDKFRSKVSVWKNADGNFNTARLASDSIAGVVLGTAGGLITSNIVKKNQIENGFEDIKCTIGGQNVAAWGDQFRIGIH